MSKTCRPLITLVVAAAVAATGQPITHAPIIPTPTSAIQTAVQLPVTDHLPGAAIAQDWIHTPTGMSASPTSPAASLTARSSGLLSSRALSEVPTVADRVSDPRDSPGSSAAPYDVGLAGSAVGQLLSPSSSCTATTIPSGSGQIAVTAAHCVYVAEDRPQLVDPPLPPGWIDELVFVPGRTGDRAPFGTWPVVRAWIDASYRDTADPAADVAFVELGRRPGPTAQEVLGAQGITFDQDPRAGLAATMLGYPVGAPFDGTLLRRCTTPALLTPDARPSRDDPLAVFGDVVAMPCGMTEGSSGGPWLTEFDAATGAGTLTAVTSFRSEDDPELIVAALLGRLAEDLFHTADTTATGDTTSSDTTSSDTTGETTARTGTGTRTADPGSSRRAASGAAENSPDAPHGSKRPEFLGAGQPSRPVGPTGAGHPATPRSSAEGPRPSVAWRPITVVAADPGTARHEPLMAGPAAAPRGRAGP